LFRYPRDHEKIISKPELDTFDCLVELPGWRLQLACLAFNQQRDLGNVMDLALRGAEAALLRDFPDGRLSATDTIGTIRVHLQRLGIEPQTTPPGSEILLRRFLDAGTIPRGSITWEFLAVLTVKSQAPWAVLDRGTLTPPLVFRTGREGENLIIPGGNVSCEGLPLLADQEGAKACPWIAPQAGDLGCIEEPVFVCFLPADIFRQVAPRNHLGRTVWLTWAYRFVFEKTCRHP
jgi:hypothetical protein